MHIKQLELQQNQNKKLHENEKTTPVGACEKTVKIVQ